MHPYDHARSSVRIHGGTWQDYYPLHSWFDATKSLVCRFTHRALRHHVEGAREAAAIFGPSIPNSDGAKIRTMTLALQHLAEDTPRYVCAEEWLAGFDAPDWLPARTPTSDALAEESVLRFGGAPKDFRSLHAWFLETANWTRSTEHLVFRHHAFGVFEAEAKFGPVIHLSDGSAVPTRVVAERHIQEVLGRVPSATEFLRRIKGERWMLRATSPRRLGLDTPLAARTLEAAHGNA